jgi:hypothetical protein
MSSSRRKLQLVASFGLLLLMALAGVGCNGFFVDPILQTITVGPTGVGILVAKTQQMTAIATYDDGTQKNITGSTSTTWTSNDQTIASVSAAGLVTGVTAITVTPSSQSVSAGNNIPFCLQAIASPSGTDISSTATWAFVTQTNIAEAGITKTSTATCTGQGFLVTQANLSPNPAPVTVNATASAPGTTGTVTSPAVTISITLP